MATPGGWDRDDDEAGDDDVVKVTLAFEKPARARDMRDRFLDLAHRMNETVKRQRERRENYR